MPIHPGSIDVSAAALVAATGLAAPPTTDPWLPRLAVHLASVQDEICAALVALEPTARFIHDDWQRPEIDLDPDVGHDADAGANADAEEGAVLQGGGRTRVLEGGEVWERAGVNLSLVWGRFSGAFAKTMPLGDGRRFAATGLSLVLHPRNPYAPTVHLNYRRMVRGATGWFGGGADLTPYYLNVDDATHFHRGLAAVCDRHPDVADYVAWKRDCDAYFYNPHRGEGRGIGGIFFDGQHGDDAKLFAFVADAARAFLPSYLPIVCGARRRPYDEAQRDWQLHRRGRYVEFNLLHDRGTVFGLRTGGRTESILMSLPPQVRWRYGHTPRPDSPEATLIDALCKPRDWLQGARGA